MTQREGMTSPAAVLGVFAVFRVFSISPSLPLSLSHLISLSLPLRSLTLSISPCLSLSPSSTPSTSIRRPTIVKLTIDESVNFGVPS